MDLFCSFHNSLKIYLVKFLYVLGFNMDHKSIKAIKPYIRDMRAKEKIFLNYLEKDSVIFLNVLG